MWLREVFEEGVDEVFELVACGCSGRDDCSELACASVVAGDEFVWLDQPLVEGFVDRSAQRLYGSIEERSISVRSGVVTGMPLRYVRSMIWLRWVWMPSCLRSVGAVTSGSR